MFTIDGSQGEGGGQVLRTCLSLSALTGRPFRIVNIRANRSRPGLRPQHLTAVRAVAVICNAELSGDALNSTQLEFHPGTAPKGGSYTFDVREASPSGRSAGAVTLVLQAILWPLVLASDGSRVTLKGGTFVPFSPPYHYLAEVGLPAFNRFGAQFSTRLDAWGWMAAGGGSMMAAIQPSERLRAFQFESLSGKRVRGVAAVTNLPSHIPHRMARRAHNLLIEAGLEPHVEPLRERGDGPGAGVALWMAQAGFSSLGRKGLPADKVAQAAVSELLTFVNRGVAVDRHLADQLILPMALAHGQSSFSTHRLTNHTLTNVALLRQWLNPTITVEGELDRPGRVTVTGVSFERG